MGLFSKRRSRNTRSRPLLRWLGPAATSVGLLYALYVFIGGSWSFSDLDGPTTNSTAPTFRGSPIVLNQSSGRSPDRIRIATFNVGQFDQSKSDTRVNEHGVDVLGTIAKLISNFDVVAIQEIQSPDGIAVRRLIDLLNQSGGRYRATISDLIGQQRLDAYAFVWDDSRVEFIEGSSYVVRDDGQRMHREPMVASFQTRLPQTETPPNGAIVQQTSFTETRSQTPFRFTLINAHTDPGKVDPDLPGSEVNVLADVFQSVREFEYSRHREDDFILLGELNVSESQLGQLKSIPGMFSIAGDIHTNVSRDTTHAHILIDRQITTEYADQMGVIDFTRDLNLTAEQAAAISNRVPVWAEFQIYEKDPPFATRSNHPRTNQNGSRTTVIE